MNASQRTADNLETGDATTTAPRPAPPVQRPPVVKPAFDPLDPRWQKGAPLKPDIAAKASGSQPAATNQRPVDAEELRRIEQAGPLVTGARLAFNRGDLGKARKKLQEALAANPTDCAALELVGDIFLADAEQEKAIAVFERGLKYHPQHYAFEEKIALALIDIEEEKRDAELRQQVLELGDRDRWQDRKPGIGLTLSLLVPGTGQFYNDENERGAVIFAAAFVTFLGWALMLNAALNGLQGRGARQLLESAGTALDSMGAVGKGFFWVMFLTWIGITIFAAWDGFIGAERHNTARRNGFGI